MFITNSSFLDGRAFDGFRKVINEEFSYAYFLDLGGHVRTISGKDSIFIGEKHTIFGISAMTGIVRYFLVKDNQEKTATNRIDYSHPFHLHELRENKFKFLAATKFSEINFEHIQLNKNNNWINITDNDFDSLLPLANKNTKLAKSQADETAIFKIFYVGIVTSRDEWLYDFYWQQLAKKVQFFCDFYEQEKVRWNQSNNKKAINDSNLFNNS